jgi:hypothetical protein
MRQATSSLSINNSALRSSIFVGSSWSPKPMDPLGTRSGPDICDGMDRLWTTEALDDDFSPLALDTQ